MGKKNPIVPRFEPEIVETQAKKRWLGDPEKVATTSVKAMEFHDVVLSSRYDKAHEYESMAAIIEELAPELRSLIDSIWCDSKANACYSVVLKPCTHRQAMLIATALDAACLAKNGGHNGIYIQEAAGGGLDIDPNWVG
jgi:hypothetical protein